KPFDHQQAQEHLHRGAMPPAGPALRAAPAEVGLDPLEESVVLEQPVQLTQLRLERHRSLRDDLEQVHGRVPVDYHGARASGRWIGVALDPTARRPYFAPQTNTTAVVKASMIDCTTLVRCSHEAAG